MSSSNPSAPTPAPRAVLRRPPAAAKPATPACPAGKAAGGGAAAAPAAAAGPAGRAAGVVPDAARGAVPGTANGADRLRLNKRMAELGLCSRREADDWIAQ